MARSWQDTTPGGFLASPAPPGVARVVGVDVARGVALLGMMAVHVFATFGDDGAPTAATTIAGGRSAATFALVAGVSLAFLSGGERVPAGRDRTAARAGIAVRAALVAALGLVLGYTDSADVILVHYALLFVLALPLLGLRPRTLFAVAAVVVAVAPPLLLATSGVDLPSVDGDSPTLGMLVDEPAGLVVELLLTGSYPAVAYLAFLAAGLAIGRLDLSAPRVAARLLGAGLLAAAGSWAVSWLLLSGLGGLGALRDAAPSDVSWPEARQHILWEPDRVETWWWLALRAPHAGSTVEIVHTLGSATAVLGAALLLTRLPGVSRILWPLAAAGACTLTLYSAHLVVLATGAGEDDPAALYAVLVAAALVLAPLWLSWRGRGPLEELVARTAGRVRRAVRKGRSAPPA